MRKHFFIGSLIIFLLVGAGCRKMGDNTAAGPVSFDSDLVSFTAPENMRVEKKGPKLSDIFTSDQLVELARQCGVTRDKAYFDDVLRDAQNITVEQYTITPKYDVSDPKSWTFTVAPNMARYGDEAAFRKDFDNCNPGGQYYPDRITEDHILFVSACAGGSDSASAPQGCSDARGAVEATITLK